MNAVVLISFHEHSDIFTAHRVYLEPHFDQAKKDFGLITSVGNRRSWELQPCEVYGWEDVLSKTTERKKQL